MRVSLPLEALTGQDLAMGRRAFPIATIALMAGCGHLIGTEGFGDDDKKETPPTPLAGDGGVAGDATMGMGGAFIDAGVTDAAAEDAWSPCDRCDSKRCEADGVCDALVFLTHGTYPGELSATPGTAAADGVCAKEAETANLKGTYKAWAAATVTTPDVPWARIAPARGKYRRSDGVIVLDAFDDMNHGQTALLAPIDLSFDGAGDTIAWPNGTEVWTAVAFNDEASASDCGQWTKKEPGFKGAYGVVGGAEYRWSYDAVGGCDTPRHFYCFQDDDSVRVGP
jgi:hypothetical protein